MFQFVLGKLWRTAAGWVDGARQAQGKGSLKDSIFKKLDRNGDGKLTVADVHIMFSDVYDETVRKKSNLLPFLAKQPLGWLALVVLAPSVFCSFVYYSVQYPGSLGLMFGLGMAAVALMALFAMGYYQETPWRKIFTKLMAIALLCVIAISDIVSYAGLMAYSRDKESTRKSTVALVGGDNRKDLKWVLDRKRQLKTATSGIPREVETVKADLTAESARRFCKSKKDWCEIATYCANKPGRSRCNGLKNLKKELGLSTEWAKLLKREKVLKQATLHGETITKADIHTDVIAKLFFLSSKTTNKYVDLGQAFFVELLVMLVLFFVTLRAMTHSDRNVKAALAMGKARRNEEMDAGADSNVAALQFADLALKLKGDGDPVVKENLEPEAALFQDDFPDRLPEAETQAGTAPAAPVQQEPETARIWKFREEALQEGSGSWVPIAHMYRHYQDWCKVRGHSPVAEAVFHDFIDDNRIIVSQVREFELGYTGMIPADIKEARKAGGLTGSKQEARKAGGLTGNKQEAQKAESLTGNKEEAKKAESLTPDNSSQEAA